MTKPITRWPQVGIRAGRRRPNPRHWQVLAELVRVGGSNSLRHSVFCLSLGSSGSMNCLPTTIGNLQGRDRRQSALRSWDTLRNKATRYYRDIQKVARRVSLPIAFQTWVQGLGGGGSRSTSVHVQFGATVFPAECTAKVKVSHGLSKVVLILC